MAENQNITLSLPRDLLKRVKRLAEDRRYSAARKRALAALRSARSLGTRGRRSWSRDELHAR